MPWPWGLSHAPTPKAIAAVTMPTSVISNPLRHQLRPVTMTFSTPTRKWASVLT